MELYNYNEIKVDEAEELNNASWKPLMRQLFVFSGVGSIYFVLGLFFGAPTVFIPQIKKDANSTEVLTDEMASWLSSVHGYSALPWVLIIPVLSRLVGRKIPFLIVCINTIVGVIVFYCSANTIQLLLSEIMQGLLLASNMTLLVVIVTEYTSTRYRGLFLAIESVIFYWGVWVANLIGTFFHWKNIGIVAFVCSLYSLSAFVWPESPSWLAMKGRFDESAAAHHWLKGFDKDSQNELVNLINSQKEYLRVCAQREENKSRYELRSVIETISTEAFYKPLLLCVAFMSLYHFSGKMVCGMYTIELIKQISDNETTAYIGMLIMDFVTIVGMQIGCGLAKVVSRRTLLFGSSGIGVIFLFAISLYLHLMSLNLISENKLLSISLLTLFSMTISVGVIILQPPLFGELIFLRYTSSSLLIITLYSQLLMATVLKVAPYIFKTLTLQGAFFFYGASASVFALILYKYLPETKDKTVQEIEAYFEEPHKSDHASKMLIDDHENIDRRLRDES
ncbi:facilitated trehalose transporter Tret1-2 homolog [Anticarsia gemmatalis]|uniref:facilitated trehalose transporter Tret1-2 homolog n=1 Tax=Anticarsia gemmatalis TaxID=129554 RepID=UPI003F765C3A